MSVAAIMMGIKECAGASFKAPALNVFGRTLSNIPGLLHRRSKSGSLLWVKPRF
jgi:hypothetical protein